MYEQFFLYFSKLVFCFKIECKNLYTLLNMDKHNSYMIIYVMNIYYILYIYTYSCMKKFYRDVPLLSTMIKFFILLFMNNEYYVYKILRLY